MEINSSLLDKKLMKDTKNSIIDISQVDNEEKFRVRLVEYINDSSYNNDDRYFWDMLPRLRFLYPNDQSIAYTTPDKEIFVNAPYKDFERKLPLYDTFYCHECLHQLWETFKVEDEIIKEVGQDKFNHYILNIASDCVINDYLVNIRKKPLIEGFVTPVWLKSNYGVDYDRKKDTQYTLYFKLIEKVDELEKDEELRKQCDPEFNGRLQPKNITKDNTKTPSRGNPGVKHSDEYIKGYTDAIKDTIDKKIDPLKYTPKKTGKEYDNGYDDAIEEIKQGLEKGITLTNNINNSSKSDLPQIPWDMPKDDEPMNKQSDSEGDNIKQDDKHKSAEENAEDYAENAKQNAKDAQEAADKAKEAADKASKNGDQDAIDKQKAASKAQKIADKAKEAADKAKEAADKKDANKEKGTSTKSSKDSLEEAKKAAEDAQKAADEAKDAAKEAGANIDNKNYNKPERGGGGKNPSTNLTYKSYNEATDEAYVNKILRRYQNKVSGTLGEWFVRKCKASKDKIISGIEVNVQKGHSTWNTQASRIVNAYIQQRVYKLKRKFEDTYRRVRRGSGLVKLGEPIKPGRKVIEQSMTIKVALYVDKSGSMDCCIDDVFKALYNICDSIKKIFKSEKLIKKFAFKIIGFDESFHEIPYGKTLNADGGTAAFNKILSYMQKNTQDYLITFMLTDAGFNAEVNEDAVKKYLDDLDGILIFITNTNEPTIKKISKNNLKLKYILADSDFKIS